MAEVGRPKKPIDWALVDKLCSIQCTGDEISSILEVHYDTLNNRCNEDYGINFSDYYKRASSSGKMSLRRKQYEVAMAGNPSMLIWLGKNVLGQSDQAQHDVRDLPPVVIQLTSDAPD